MIYILAGYQFVYVTTLFFLFVLVSYIVLLFLLFSFEVKVFVFVTPSGTGLGSGRTALARRAVRVMKAIRFTDGCSPLLNCHFAPGGHVNHDTLAGFIDAQCSAFFIDVGNHLARMF